MGKHNFAEDLSKLASRNKTSIYTLLLVKLSNFPIKSRVDQYYVNSLSDVLKKMILDHSQSLAVLLFHLKQTIPITGLSPQIQRFLTDVVLTLKKLDVIKNFSIEEITETSLDTRISRQLESQLAITLLQSPSPKMWNSVNKISATIISLIQAAENPEFFSSLLHHVNGKKGNEVEPNIPLAFAHFSSTKTLNDIITILQEGDDLASVMLIQFMFMRDAFLNLDISQKFYESILTKEYAGYFKKFLSELSLPEDSSQIVNFFSSYVSFSPQLYSDRGRSEFRLNLDNHLGITINKEDRSSMPILPVSWYPDTICQAPELKSNYVASLAQHDIPYVAGSSGMTSLLMGALTILGSNTNSEEKNYYLLAVLAFIVGGGLHSIHEVLSVCENHLGLIPGYQITGENMGNYDTFFSLFAKDLEITNLIEKSWSQLIQWFNVTYPKSCEVLERQYPEQPDEDNTNACCIM